MNAFELRQHFQDTSLYCVTHIPAGRALNLWAKFFQNVRGETNPNYFWHMLNSVSLQVAPADTPNFNLAVFREAFGYHNGGTISGIHESQFGPTHFFAGLLDSFLGQYLDLLLEVDPEMTRPISIAGNMATKIPNIKEWFSSSWNAPVTIQQGIANPTLACMSKLAINGLQDRI